MDRDLQKIKAFAGKTQDPEVAKVQTKIATDGFEGEKFFKYWLRYQSRTKKFIDDSDELKTNHLVLCLKAYHCLRGLNKQLFLQYDELPFTEGLTEQSYLEFAKMIKKQDDVWDEKEFDKLYEYLLIHKGKLLGGLKEGVEHHEANKAYIVRIHEIFERIFKLQLIRGKMIDP